MMKFPWNTCFESTFRFWGDFLLHFSKLGGHWIPTKKKSLKKERKYLSILILLISSFRISE